MHEHVWSLSRREFLRHTGRGGIVVLGTAAGLHALAGEASGLPTGGQNSSYTQHQKETMEALADTAIPGYQWALTGEIEDNQGFGGAVQAGAWTFFWDPYYGINPYIDDLTSDVDSYTNFWYGKQFKRLTLAQRHAVLKDRVRNGGFLGILAPAYDGAIGLAKFAFFSGVVNRVGTDYIQFPGPSAGYTC